MALTSDNSSVSTAVTSCIVDMLFVVVDRYSAVESNARSPCHRSAASLSAAGGRSATARFACSSSNTS